MRPEDLNSLVQLEGSGRDLHVHLSPSTTSTDQCVGLGGAVAVAVLSLVTKTPPSPRVALGSDILSFEGALLDRLPSHAKDIERVFRLAKTTVEVDVLVVGRTAVDKCSAEADKVGLDLVGVGYLFEAIDVVFPVHP